MNQQTLAQMVRAKYPGAYDDLSDQQLEASVKAKFPGVYDDVPTTQAQPEQPKSTPWLQQFSNRDMVEHGTRHADTVPTDVAFDRARNMAPAAASIGAAYATGGMSIPVQMAAVGGAGALGQAVKDAPAEMSIGDRFSNMALEGLKQATIQGGVAKVVQAVPRLQQAARNLWNRQAKITEPIAKTTQTAQAGGSLDKAKDEIAETLLSRGKGTIRSKNVEDLRDIMTGLDDQIEQIVTNSKGMVSRQELRSALQSYKASIPVGSQAGESARDAIDRSLALLNKMPAKMTVAKAHALKRDIYERHAKSYAADVAQQSTASADKVTGRALRSGIAREEPGVRPLDAQLSKLIPATKAMEKAVSRTGNQSPVGLSQMLAGVVTKPATVAAALINHPQIGSFTAQQLYNAAKRLPTQARTAANIIRMASIGSSGDPVASHQTGRD